MVEVWKKKGVAGGRKGKGDFHMDIEKVQMLRAQLRVADNEVDMTKERLKEAKAEREQLLAALLEAVEEKGEEQKKDVDTSTGEIKTAAYPYGGHDVDTKG